MDGKGNRRTGTKQKQDKTKELLEENPESEACEHEDDTAEKMDGQDHNETLRIEFATISKDLKQEIRHELKKK